MIPSTGESYTVPLNVDARTNNIMQSLEAQAKAQTRVQGNANAGQADAKVKLSVKTKERGVDGEGTDLVGESWVSGPMSTPAKTQHQHQHPHQHQHQHRREHEHEREEPQYGDHGDVSLDVNVSHNLTPKSMNALTPVRRDRSGTKSPTPNFGAEMKQRETPQVRGEVHWTTHGSRLGPILGPL